MSERLITFGCSYTYGHGLQDCYDSKTGHAGPQPSRFAWPNILGKKLKKRIVNLSQPGASNKEILYYLQNFIFHKSDLVVILWTYPHRDCILVDSNKIIQATARDNYNWYIEKIKHGDFDVYHQMWTYINYAKLYLDNKNISNYHFTIDFRYIVNPPKFNIVYIEDLDFLKIRDQFDVALDKDHPGKMGHLQTAKQMKVKIDAYNK